MSEILFVSPFEFRWADAAELRMASLPVVEDLDVLVDSASGFVARGPGLPIDEFAFERGEEALDDGVVVAVSAAARGACDARIAAVSSLALESF